LLFVAPVGAGGIDVVDGQDLAGPEFDDGDAGGVGESQDFPALVGGADAEVVHAAGMADADLAAGVDVVVAQPVAPLGAPSGSALGRAR
jgi:hypothetical protein